MTQESDGPTGFANCTKLACTTADTSIAAGENLNFQQIIEGQDLQRICKGTSDAKEITFSFYVKGNAAATYTVELFDANNSRQISKTFSVTTAWTRVSLTYPADTTGAFADSNAAALYVIIWLHAGSTYTGGTLNSTSWAASVEANRVSSSQTSFLDSTARTFFITGVQLEAGAATDFEHRSFGDELQRCERYYQKLLKHGDGSAGAQAALGATGFMYNSTYLSVPLNLRTQMRTHPTLISADSSGCFRFYRNNSKDKFDDFGISNSRTTYAIELYNITDVSGTGGDAGFIDTVNSNATLAVDAEL